MAEAIILPQFPPDLSGYALTTHNHDTAYSKTDHNHDKTYSKTTHTHTNYLTETNVKNLIVTNGLLYQQSIKYTSVVYGNRIIGNTGNASSELAYGSTYAGTDQCMGASYAVITISAPYFSIKSVSKRPTHREFVSTDSNSVIIDTMSNKATITVNITDPTALSKDNLFSTNSTANTATFEISLGSTVPVTWCKIYYVNDGQWESSNEVSYIDLIRPHLICKSPTIYSINSYSPSYMFSGTHNITFNISWYN